MPPRALKPAGIVLVDKPAGPSSFAIVARVRNRTGAKLLGDTPRALVGVLLLEAAENGADAVVEHSSA